MDIPAGGCHAVIMSDPRTLTTGACEILVARELRKAGIEPIGLRRADRGGANSGGADWAVDLGGRLEAYGRRWSALVECRNCGDAVRAGDVAALRARADAAGARSALLFATCDFDGEAVHRADELRIALLRIVDAYPALLGAGVVQPGSLPAWVPELTVELVSRDGDGLRRQLLEADQPEPVLEQLRARA